MTTPTPDELLAKCDRILDFEDGDARSFTVQFAEEVKAVVVPLRKRLAEAENILKLEAYEAITLGKRLAEVVNRVLGVVDDDVWPVGTNEIRKRIIAALAHDKGPAVKRMEGRQAWK